MFQASPNADAKILLIEDDRLSGRMVGFHFEALGRQTEHAMTAAAALEMFAAGRFALVLLDLELPDKTGLEVAELIRQKEEGHIATPIIALTAHQDPRYKDKAMAAGMNDLFVKPLTENCAQKIFDKFLTG